MEEKRSCGGKGIDVSRVIRELGGHSVALVSWGLQRPRDRGKTDQRGIVCDFTRISGETREHITIHQRKKTQTLLSTSPAEVTPFELTMLHHKIRQIAAGSYVVVSGRIPPGLHDSFYAQVTTTLKEKDAKVFLDADGEALKKGVQAGPSSSSLIFTTRQTYREEPEGPERGVGRPLALPRLFSVCRRFPWAGEGPLGPPGGEYYAVPPKVNVKSSTGSEMPSLQVWFSR